MKVVITVVLGAITAVASFGCPLSMPPSSRLPEKWRQVTKSNEKWRYHQPCGPYLTASNDFDGDGKFDEVFFSENTNTHEFAILAKLSTQAQTIYVAKIKSIRGKGLDSYTEGENERDCSKENGDIGCKPGEVIKFTTKYRPVLLFDDAGACFYIWTPESHNFKRYKVWSDPKKAVEVVSKKK
jgi:hypothetical protein